MGQMAELLLQILDNHSLNAASGNFLVFSSRYEPGSFALFSVTRLGDLLDFGQVFKAFGNN